VNRLTYFLSLETNVTLSFVYPTLLLSPSLPASFSSAPSLVSLSLFDSQLSHSLPPRETVTVMSDGIDLNFSQPKLDLIFDICRFNLFKNRSAVKRSDSSPSEMSNSSTYWDLYLANYDVERIQTVRLGFLRLSFDAFSPEKKEIVPHFSICGNSVTIDMMSTKSGDLTMTFQSREAEIRDLNNPTRGFETLLSNRAVIPSFSSCFYFELILSS
jgi:hypothetical protein